MAINETLVLAHGYFDVLQVRGYDINVEKMDTVAIFRSILMHLKFCRLIFSRISASLYDCLINVVCIFMLICLIPVGT